MTNGNGISRLFQGSPRLPLIAGRASLLFLPFPWASLKKALPLGGRPINRHILSERINLPAPAPVIAYCAVLEALWVFLLHSSPSLYFLLMASQADALHHARQGPSSWFCLFGPSALKRRVRPLWHLERLHFSFTDIRTPFPLKVRMYACALDPSSQKA